MLNRALLADSDYEYDYDNPENKKIVIFVDWSRFGSFLPYTTARGNIQTAAGAIAKFMDYLADELNADHDKMTLIGFSLGAHVAGMVGQNISIGRIIGIDPAGPLFSVDEFDKRLNNDSAQYVECIHTGGWMNLQDHICTNDIFINGGKR